MKKIIILLILFVTTVLIYACDCKSITIAEETNTSELIFIGNVIEKKNNHYFIKPQEVFKGDISIIDSVFKVSLGNCLINPKNNETWLIFATYSHNKIEISQCGNSTSFNKPFSFKEGFIPPPIPTNISREMNLLIKNSYENKAYNKLLFEISNLRSVKNNEKLLKIKTSFNNRFNIIKWLLILTIFILLILEIRRFINNK